VANGGAALEAHATCSQATGLCELEPNAIAVAEAPQSIRIGQPMPGDHFDLNAPIDLRWSPVSMPVILVVLDRVPDSGEDFSQLAIWGAAFGPGASVAGWNDGYDVVHGAWTQPAHALPSGVYYLLIEGVSGGALTAVSALVPFAVGESGWPGLGDPCTGPETPNCYNPAFAAACVGGICQRMCLSHVLDCGEGGYCNPPDAQQVRVCAM
jgi:hypothetical protein